MGNRALRKEAAAALKRAGYSGKLYHGPKLKMFKYMRAYELRHLIFLANLRVGDYVNDCDGFNHKITKINVVRRWYGVIDFEQFEFEDGRLSCGCPSGPVEAWTNEQIAEFHKYDDEYIETLKSGGWWTEINQKFYDRLMSGEAICDEHGCKLSLE
jgi:hypothetical protein